MDPSRMFFSWISVKKVSDCPVFHQFLIQSSRSLLKEKDTPHGKSMINTRYRKEDNDFFFYFSSFNPLFPINNKMDYSDI